MRAYEALQDRRSRIEADLFGIADCEDHLLALDMLLPVKSKKRCIPSLKTLIAAEGIVND